MKLYDLCRNENGRDDFLKVYNQYLENPTDDTYNTMIELALTFTKNVRENLDLEDYDSIAGMFSLLSAYCLAINEVLSKDFVANARSSREVPAFLKESAFLTEVAETCKNFASTFSDLYLGY